MISDIAQQIANDCSKLFDNVKQNAPDSSGLRVIIESNLKKLNLVTREEFDAQTEVLTRTRSKIDELEKVIEELESKINQT